MEVRKKELIPKSFEGYIQPYSHHSEQIGTRLFRGSKDITATHRKFPVCPCRVARQLIWQCLPKNRGRLERTGQASFHAAPPTSTFYQVGERIQFCANFKIRSGSPLWVASCARRRAGGSLAGRVSCTVSLGGRSISRPS